MDLEILYREKNLVLRFYGELDHHSSTRIRKAINKEWEKELSRNIIFNLEHLAFMDSSGVGVIMGRYEQAGKTGGKVAVCAASPALMKVLELSGLLKLVEVYPTEEEALKEMATK